MENTNLFLLEILEKEFPEKQEGKLTGKNISYVEIWLSDRLDKIVYKVKPFSIREFLINVPKFLPLRGQPVTLEFKQVLDGKGNVTPRLVNILPVKKPKVM